VLSDPDIGAFETTHLVNEPHYLVRQAIEDFADQSLPSDLLLLYFSGHGIKDEGGNLYLAASDTRRDRPRSTGVEAGFVDGVLRHARARRQVLVLDCCFSGAFPVGMASKSDGTVVVSEHLNSRGRVVLASSNSIQYSFEGSELVDSNPVGSVFTQALVSGLRSGDADLNSDGEIDIDELYEYIYDQVAEVTPDQTPQKTAERIQGEILIARNPFLRSAGAVASARAQEARAELLSQQLKEAMIARSSTLPEARHAAVLAMSRIAVSASESAPELKTEIAAALGPLTLDADPHVALAAQTELDRLVTKEARPPQLSTAEPVPPRGRPETLRPLMGWALAAILAVTASMLGVVILTDGDQPNEVGGISVTPGTDDPAPTLGTPQSTLPAPVVETIDVPPDGAWPGQANWIDTGITLEVGERIEIDAEGEATHDGGASWSGPNGDTNGDVRFNLAEFPLDNHNALVGRIGGDGVPFLIGEHASFAVDNAGTLYLGVNDQGVENNGGQYVASIAVTPVPTG